MANQAELLFWTNKGTTPYQVALVSCIREKDRSTYLAVYFNHNPEERVHATSVNEFAMFLSMTTPVRGLINDASRDSRLPEEDFDKLIELTGFSDETENFRTRLSYNPPEYLNGCMNYIDEP